MPRCPRAFLPSLVAPVHAVHGDGMRCLHSLVPFGHGIAWSCRRHGVVEFREVVRPLVASSGHA